MLEYAMHKKSLYKIGVIILVLTVFVVFNESKAAKSKSNPVVKDYYFLQYKLSDTRQPIQIEILGNNPDQYKYHFRDQKGKRMNRMDINESYKVYDVQGNVLIEENYKKGLMHGVQRTYHVTDQFYPNGEIRLFANYRKGHKEGMQKVFRYSNGTIELEEYYRKKLIRYRKDFNNEGIITNELIYKDGELKEKKLYDTKGQLVQVEKVGGERKNEDK